MNILRDETSMAELRVIFFATSLAERNDALITRPNRQQIYMEARDARITELETQVVSLETEIDRNEQYKRRQNLRIQGVPETTAGEDATVEVLAIINGSMAVTPPIEEVHIGRSHRIDPQRKDETRPRAIIGRFENEHVRDRLYQERRNPIFHLDNIFMNEDLTARRSDRSTTCSGI